jgi:Beta-galactosidase/beta-glucuronidase
MKNTILGKSKTQTTYFSKGICLLLLIIFSVGTSAAQVRQIISIDKDWKFFLGDAENAQSVNFNDNDWRQLRVPHDWSIEGDYDSLAITKRGGGYLPAGIGWYRKTLTFNKADKGKRIYVEFGAVMSNSDVWINGHLLGHRPFGYLPLFYDLTDYITFDGKPNTLAVRAENTEQPASRWYAGAGIYRHVNLIVVNPIHIERYGVFIHTPVATTEHATVAVETSIANVSKKAEVVTIKTEIISPLGKKAFTEPLLLTISAGETVKYSQNIFVESPEIWDIESPNIYQAITTVSINGKIIDDQKNTFGIRESHFDASTGFWLNGRNIKLLGACAHHDGGALGSAVPASVWERRILRLKEVGCNAIRGAHSPMDPAFYEICDRLGMLVMDETFDTWTAAKPNGQRAYNLYFREWWEIDCAAQIMRVRNHPSIVIYSLGNEIRDNLNSEEGRKHFLGLKKITKELDPTRPVTMALFRPQQANLYNNGFSELLDVIGQNYGEQGLLAVRNGRPERKIIGTENTPARSSWLAVRDNPAMSGMFIWTGFGYLGEADWPQIAWDKCLFDRNAGWKTTAWERQSWWSEKPMVRIVRSSDNGRELVDDWTTASDTVKSVNVFVYSNCEEVELFLNGQSLGVQPTPDDDSPNQWKVDFAAGTIKAVGRNGGKDLATHQHITASAPETVLLTTEKTVLENDWEEVVYITATIVDKNGICNPNTSHKVKFSISGPGEIVSVDNSDPFSHERYKGDTRTVYKGSAIAIVRATAGSGEIIIRATADGLYSGEVSLSIKN